MSGCISHPEALQCQIQAGSCSWSPGWCWLQWTVCGRTCGWMQCWPWWRLWRGRWACIQPQAVPRSCQQLADWENQSCSQNTTWQWTVDWSATSVAWLVVTMWRSVAWWLTACDDPLVGEKFPASVLLSVETVLVTTSAVAMGVPVQGPKGEEYAASFRPELISFTLGRLGVFPAAIHTTKPHYWKQLWSFSTFQYFDQNFEVVFHIQKQFFRNTFHLERKSIFSFWF